MDYLGSNSASLSRGVWRTVFLFTYIGGYVPAPRNFNLAIRLAPATPKGGEASYVRAHGL